MIHGDEKQETSLMTGIPETRAPFYQAEKIRARINSSFAYEDR